MSNFSGTLKMHLGMSDIKSKCIHLRIKFNPLGSSAKESSPKVSFWKVIRIVNFLSFVSDSLENLFR